MALSPIIEKDLRILVRDRRTLILLFAMPICLISILGLTAGQLLSRWSSRRLDLVAADLDRGPRARRVVEILAANRQIDIEEVSDAAEARARVERGARTAAVIIGPRFTGAVDSIDLLDVMDIPHRKLGRGLRSLDVEVYTRATAPLARVAIRQFVFGQILRLIILPAALDRVALLRGFLEMHLKRELGTAERENPLENDLFFSELGASSVQIYQTLVPSYTVMFAFFLIVLMARSILNERQTGTLLRLRVAPLSSAGLVAGKTAPFLLVSLAQGIILFVSGKLLFGMSWGNSPELLLLVIASTSLAATGLGLLVATVARTDAQMSAWASLLVLVLGGLSGCLVPRDWMPQLLQQISLATPHAWALMAYDEVLAAHGPNPLRVLTNCAVLFTFAAACFVTGVWRFSRVSAEDLVPR